MNIRINDLIAYSSLRNYKYINYWKQWKGKRNLSKKKEKENNNKNNI